MSRRRDRRHSGGRPDRDQRTDRSDRADRPDRAGRPDRADRTDRSDRPDSPDRTDRRGGPGRPDRPDRGSGRRDREARAGILRDVAILVAAFGVGVGAAELFGAANLGVAFGVGQVVFALTLIVRLTRA